eukprot:gene7127-232_t
MVKQIKSTAEWEEHMDGSKTVVVDFTATWCGPKATTRHVHLVPTFSTLMPCCMIGPVFEELSTNDKYAVLEFVKVDVDELAAMPTFQAWKDGKMVLEVVGASKEKLITFCNEAAAL